MNQVAKVILACIFHVVTQKSGIFISRLKARIIDFYVSKCLTWNNYPRNISQKPFFVNFYCNCHMIVARCIDVFSNDCSAFNSMNFKFQKFKSFILFIFVNVLWMRKNCKSLLKKHLGHVELVNMKQFHRFFLFENSKKI